MEGKRERRLPRVPVHRCSGLPGGCWTAAIPSSRGRGVRRSRERRSTRVVSAREALPATNPSEFGPRFLRAHELSTDSLALSDFLGALATGSPDSVWALATQRLSDWISPVSQEYQHTKGTILFIVLYIVPPPRCVRCREGHGSSTCLKTRETPATCALCVGDHPANYKG
ncbi:hypothetical protein AAG570_005415 [Ranatra chinensis]|uniref:Uncharacterized protein n=1 Tax=Ranatra chinensis TaxID=642074 RepID=A0ABD0XZ35_9HEMI